jgi:hypothetical protein
MNRCLPALTKSDTSTATPLLTVTGALPGECE